MKYTIFAVFFAFLSLLVYPQDKQTYKLSGYMFGDYYYNIARDSSIASLSNTATGGVKDLNGFQIRRIYLTYDNDISPDFSARFRMEGTTSGSPIVKDAFLKWKNVFSGSDLIFGLQATPAFEISEGVWGYRSLEKTILDLRGIVTSRDLAVSLKGKVNEDGSIKYWLMAGNNSNTGTETDKYKRLYGHIQLAPTEKISMTFYGDYKMQPAVNDLKSATTPKATLNHNVLTTALFIGYTEKDAYKFGAEGFLQSTPNDYKDGSADSLVAKNAFGLSLFGSYNISEKVVLIGRFDLFDANLSGKAKGDSRNYAIAGIDWKVDKNVSLIPNIQIETYENVPSANGEKSIDSSITGRITFYYVFL